MVVVGHVLNAQLGGGGGGKVLIMFGCASGISFDYVWRWWRWPKF